MKDRNFIGFTKWLSRCNSCKNRKRCLLRDVITNWNAQATCYREG